MIRPAAAAAFVVALLTLGACSSGADSADVAPTSSTFSASSSPTTAPPNPGANTSPSPGSVTSDDKMFNLVVPGGWNLTDHPQTVAYLSSATVAHDVAPTISVTRSSVTPAPSLDETVQMAMLEARADGAAVTRLPERAVGAEKAASFEARTQEKNVAITRTYTVVAHERTLYVITLTAATDDAAAASSTLNALLASWTWTKRGDAHSTADGTTPAAVKTTTSSSAAPSKGTTSPPTSAPSASPSSSAGSAASSPKSARSTATSAPSSSR